MLVLSGLNALDGAPHVLAAAAALARKAPEVEVVVAGHQNDPPYAARGAALPNVRMIGYVAKGSLAPLMRDSVALLYLSRYESFGVAAAEAMAAGAPVIGTRFTAVPEIVGGAGILADADNPEGVADHVAAIAGDPSLRARLAASGRERAAHFTWAACVARLLGALRTCAAGPDAVRPPWAAKPLPPAAES